MSAAFSNWVRHCVHENAPDHSTQTVAVGKLREAADTIEELYEALALLVSANIGNLDELVDAQVAGNRALDKARGDQ